jgi:hypothetical protein
VGGENDCNFCSCSIEGKTLSELSTVFPLTFVVDLAVRFGIANEEVIAGNK